MTGSDGGIVASAELYDPATGTFSPWHRWPPLAPATPPQRSPTVASSSQEDGISMAGGIG